MAKAKTRGMATKTHRFLYLLAKLLGDLQAAREGRVGKRAAVRRTGAGHGLGKALEVGPG